MATVTPIKRNNSKTDNRIIPIKVAKTLITRHIEQRVVNTHNPSADFPSISEHFSPSSRNMHGNFIPEDRSYTIPRRTHDPDKLKTFIQIDPGHKITQNSGYIVLATTCKPTPRIGSIPMNHAHRGQPDRFVSNDDIIELLSYIGHNPQTHRQQGNDVGSKTPYHAQTPPTNNISASQGKHGTYSSNVTYASAQRPISLSPSTFMTHGMLLLNKITMHSATALELDTSPTQEDPRDLNGTAQAKPKHRPPIFALRFNYKS
jgi:hypothetical protein